MRYASKALFAATGNWVQLGKVTFKPASQSSDPDILITEDCPSGKIKTYDLNSTVCADAPTGGYLGSEYWKGSATTVYDSYSVNKANRPGAHITISWQTLRDYKSSVLLHELGHYLFSMRDEYEWVGYTKSYTTAIEKIQALSALQLMWEANAIVQDPAISQGYALTNYFINNSSSSVTYDRTASPDYVSSSSGNYAMGYLNSSASGNNLLYSPATLGSESWKLEGIDASRGTSGIANIRFLEQASTQLTRGPTPKGGMYNVQISLNTAFTGEQTKATLKDDDFFTSEELPAIAHAWPTNPALEFVLDWSGSMHQHLYNSEEDQSFSRWDAALNVMGNLVNKSDWDSRDYSMGLIAFATTPTELEDLNSDILTIRSYLKEKDGRYVPNNTLLPAIPNGSSTNLNDALDLANDNLKGQTDATDRYTILFSDGEQNNPWGETLITTTKRDYPVHIFAIAREATNADYAQSMLDLKNNTNGSITYVNGDLDFTTAFTQVFDKLTKNATTAVSAPENIYFDHAATYDLTLTEDMVKVEEAISFKGNIAPTIEVYKNGILYSLAGITITRSYANQIVVSIDPSIADLGNYTIKVSNANAQPITIATNTTITETKVRVYPIPHTVKVVAGNDLPISARVTYGGEPVNDLQVNAYLYNYKFNTTQKVTLSASGNRYAGSFPGVLPGPSLVKYEVIHPNNGQVRYAPGENNSATNLPAQVPYFVPRFETENTYVYPNPSITTVDGLKVYSMSDNIGFDNGTYLRIKLENHSGFDYTGLKARYYFNTAELSGTNPIYTANNLSSTTKVRIAQVPGQDGLWYAEFDLSTQTLLNGQSSTKNQPAGDGIILSFSNWNSLWDRSNDYSGKNLDHSWRENTDINIYDANGVLLCGSRLFEGNQQIGNAAPLVSLSTINFYPYSGSIASFTANVNDPEDGTTGLSYKWIIDSKEAVGLTTQNIDYTFNQLGTHIIKIIVTDSQGTSSYSEIQVEVVGTNGAGCEVIDDQSFRVMNSQTQLNIHQGSNCYLIPASALPTSWLWTKVMMQISPTDNQVLDGIQLIPYNATSMELLGWSQQLAMKDPGYGKDLLFRFSASSNRSIRANWWVAQ